MTTWSVVNIIVKPQYEGFSNVVYIVNWIALCIDGENISRQGGETELAAPAGSSFIPYDQLTEQEVIGWVQSALGPEEVAKIEANLLSQLEYMANPPVVLMPLPWA